MAFNSNVPRAEYIAATGQTVFPFVFKIFEQTDVKVYLTPNGQISDDVTDLLQSGYTVSVNGDAGGSVTLSSATTTGDKITLLRNLPVVRNTDYQENGDLRASTLDSDQDYQTYLVGDLSSRVDKVVKFPESAQGLDGTLPSPSPDNYIRWNSTGTALINDTAIPNAVIQAEDARDEATAQAGISANKAGEASVSAKNALASELQAQAYSELLDPTKTVAKDSSTGAAYIPVGTTAQRPASPTNGYLRYNTDLLSMEAYSNGSWGSVGGGTTGGGTDNVFYENDQVITADYTIPVGKNAMSAGDITINAGVTVTVSSGSKWSIV